MPNTLTVEIYVKRADVQTFLDNKNVTHVLVQGTVTVNSDNTYSWSVQATGYPTAGITPASTCPHPC